MARITIWEEGRWRHARNGIRVCGACTDQTSDAPTLSRLSRSPPRWRHEAYVRAHQPVLWKDEASPVQSTSCSEHTTGISSMDKLWCAAIPPPPRGGGFHYREFSMSNSRAFAAYILSACL